MNGYAQNKASFKPLHQICGGIVGSSWMPLFDLIWDHIHVHKLSGLVWNATLRLPLCGCVWVFCGSPSGFVSDHRHLCQTTLRFLLKKSGQEEGEINHLPCSDFSVTLLLREVRKKPSFRLDGFPWILMPLPLKSGVLNDTSAPLHAV